MTLKNRFMLVGLGMVIFILITPVIVLYALGYKFDLQSKQIVKTGTLIVKSEPRRAQIYIDDLLQSDNTDANIRFLLPGDYNVKISKPGYQSWTKRLNIRSSLVTWTNQDREFITLFYEQPIEKETKTFSQSAVSFEDNRALITQQDLINIYNPNNGELSQISTPAPTITPPVVLPNKSHLYYLLRYPITHLLSAEQLSSTKQLEANESYAAVLIGTNLYQIQNGAIITLLAENVSGFDLDNEHLWYVEGTILKHANINLGVIENITTLNYTPFNSTVIRGDSHLFLILDQTLYALNDKLEEVQRGVTYAYWDSETGRLVIANNNEVNLFDPVSFKKDLIIRSSTALTQPMVNDETGYLFFLNEGRLKAIELDGRDHRNVYTITSEPAKSFLLAENGKTATLFTDTTLKLIEIRE